MQGVSEAICWGGRLSDEHKKCQHRWLLDVRHFLYLYFIALIYLELIILGLMFS